MAQFDARRPAEAASPISTREPTPHVIADPFVQVRLLDLQAVDTALSQLAHRRRALPELALIEDANKRASEIRVQQVDAETAVADLAAEQRRLEADIDNVRQRADKDQARMISAGVPAKEVSGLQHEVASLARRQSVLEDELLEVMEQRESADVQVADLIRSAEAIAAERAAAVEARDEVFAEIDATEAKRRIERDELATQIPSDLLDLYEKVRQANGGVGAAMLRQHRCEGCRLELAGSELSAVRNAKPDQVLRCENCRRILVRTHESGL
jgi:predicted  nucleic acid-binding Zn-ribbon protein